MMLMFEGVFFGAGRIIYYLFVRYFRIDRTGDDSNMWPSTSQYFDCSTQRYFDNIPSRSSTS